MRSWMRCLAITVAALMGSLTAIALQAAGAGRPIPSVDLLLSSAAALYGDKLIAVILTGTGSDGAAGARAGASALTPPP